MVGDDLEGAGRDDVSGKGDSIVLIPLCDCSAELRNLDNAKFMSVKWFTLILFISGVSPVGAAVVARETFPWKVKWAGE